MSSKRNRRRGKRAWKRAKVDGRPFRCDGYSRPKRCYFSQQQAWRARTAMAAEHPEEKFDSWKCVHCGFWHVGRPRPVRHFNGV